jgi:hypothetical protein
MSGYVLSGPVDSKYKEKEVCRLAVRQVVNKQSRLGPLRQPFLPLVVPFGIPVISNSKYVDLGLVL